jgi:threonine synthase
MTPTTPTPTSQTPEARTQSFVTHLEAAIDATRLPARVVQTTHESRPLWVRYDLEAVATAMSKAALKDRPATLWRYRELLPVDNDGDIVSLGEGMTPLLDCPRLARKLGVDRLLVKDESQLPTGSFKSRGMTMAVSMAKQLGITRVAVPTAGNAGGALAAYAARADIACWVFMPADTPGVNKAEASLFGAHAYQVDGLITDCARIVGAGKERMGWFDMSTLKEPYRIEGKKTMGLELAEQMDWTLPDVVLYPTGGGTGLIGMWKAFAELGAMGWLDSPARPRMFACQSSTCAPIPSAFDAGKRFAGVPDQPRTIASGLRVPKAVGDFMILDAVRESGGRAMTAHESRIMAFTRLACETEGISVCPEAAACIDVLERSLAQGHILRTETVVIFNTGAVQKYIELLDTSLPTMDADEPDFDALAAE